MKKINVSLVSNNGKEDAILKIKDDSFSITTNDNSIIKIPYSDVSDYDYTQDEVLTIKRKHSSDIIIEVSFDITLINKLKEIVTKPSDQNELISTTKYSEPQKTTNITQETSTVNSVNTKSDNNAIFKIVGILVVIGACVAVYCLALNPSTKNPDTIPTSNQGYYKGEKTFDLDYFEMYYVFKVTGSSLKYTTCYLGDGKSVSECDFNTSAGYTIKDIEVMPDGTSITFNAYDGEEKTFKCSAGWNDMTCEYKSGIYFNTTKE